MIKYLYAFFPFLILSLVLTSCGSTKYVVIQPNTSKVSKAQIQVGASQVNITPYPGFPMGGYGSGGKISRGKWLDLFVKTTYIQDSRGNRLAIVSCDLWSVPIGLGLKVGEILSKELDDIYHLGSNQILLCATHTHNSQAGFSTSEAYNALASPIAGFDPKMFEFLVDMITESIKEAIDNKKPAVGAISHSNIEGYIRNRSIDAFERIEVEIQTKIKANVKNADAYLTNPDLPAFIKRKEEFEAVDPVVTTLTFTPTTNTVPTPIAIVNFISMHPTVLGHETSVYSADVFGVTELHLKNRTGFYSTVISFVNGSEGDVSPNWLKQDYKNVIDIGQGIGEKILENFSSARPLLKKGDSLTLKYDIVNIKNAFVSVPLRGNVPACFEHIPSQTASSPYPGIATLGGAEDGRTLLYAQGMYEGIAAIDCTDGHGNKINAINSGVDLTFAPLPGILKGLIGATFKSLIKRTAPDVVPIGIYSIGNFSIAGIPGEPTTALGYYIKESIRQSHPNYTNDKIVIAGLANEYLSYFTTPAEYGAQQYEGASSMYGVHAGSFLEEELGKLAKSNNTKLKIKEVKSKIGKNANLFQGQIFRPEWNKSEGLANFYVDLVTGKPYNKFPIIEYNIPSPAQDKLYDAQYPNIFIERYNSRTDKFMEISNDKNSTGLISILKSRKNGKDLWQTVWIGSSAMDKNFLYRIKVVHPLAGTMISKNINLNEKEQLIILKEN
jgi:neutral ceramidase